MDDDSIDWYQFREDIKATLSPEDLPYEEAWWRAACAVSGAPVDPQPLKK